MKNGVLSTVLLFVTLALACCFAPTLEPAAEGLVLMAWIPALLAGAWAVTREKRSPFFAVLLIAAGGYATWRALTSPVPDLGRSDLHLLACGTAACFWAGWLVSRRAHHWAVAAVAVMAMVNLAVALVQWKDPTYTPVFGGRETSTFPSGLYGHYNSFANFLLAAGFLAGGCSLEPGRSIWKRIAWALVAIASLGGVYLSHSRGALAVAVPVGILVLLVGWLLDLKRRRVAWFGAALLGGVILIVPLGGLGAWYVSGKMLADRARSGQPDQLTADSGRVIFATLALRTTDDHPWTGGGSRSFSYESLCHWPKDLWGGSGDIEFVHNEILQTTTDYGWTGTILVTALLFAAGLRGILVLSLEPEDKTVHLEAGLTIGALAATAAVLCQSMFSFVFHMAPDVIVLGLLIGIVVAQPWPFDRIRERPALLMRPALWVAVGLAGGMAILGWRDAAAWWIAFRPGSAGEDPHQKVRFNALVAAAAVCPDYRTEKSAAVLASRIAEKDREGEGDEWQERSYQHFQATVFRNPEDQAARLNLARLLDSYGKFDEAEGHYLRLLPAMDRREYYYRTRCYYASHLYRRADALFKARRASEALAWGLEAKRQMEISTKLCWMRPDSEDGREAAKISDFVKFLQDTRNTPDPDATVPVVPDPK